MAKNFKKRPAKRRESSSMSGFDQLTPEALNGKIELSEAEEKYSSKKEEYIPKKLQHEESKLNNGVSISDNIKFINPYNFIYTGDEINRSTLSHSKNGYTGYIDCTLIAKTPLIIPSNPLDPDADHKKYDVLSVDDHYIISGSEIRGVVRNMYESLSSSCLSTTEKLNFTSRYNGYMRNAGLLYKDKLVQATVAKLQFKDFKDKNPYHDTYIDTDTQCFYLNGRKCKTGQVLYIDPIEKEGRNNVPLHYVLNGHWSFTPKENYKMAYFNLGESKINQGKYVKLFYIEDNNIVTNNQSVVDRLRSDYFEVLSEYKDEKNIAVKREDSNFKQYVNLDINENSEVIPVWYDEVKTNLYVSPAQRGRIVYNMTSENLLKQFNPCNDDKLCPACSLFGTIGDNFAVPSKVRFTDATESKNVRVSKDFITLPALASPHYSNAEFYLYSNKLDSKYGNQLFNYDYYFTDNGRKFLFEDKDQLSIRGRKMYWHFNPSQFYNSKNVEPTSLNTSNKYYETNSEFTFKVYFDNITKRQLQQLIITLNLEGNDNDQCYKIGHGKSVGYGSAKIKVNDVKYRNIDTKNSFTYTVDTFKDRYIDYEEAFGPNKQVYYEVRAMTDFNLIKEDAVISYPIDENTDEGFSWFSNNKLALSQSDNKVYYVNQKLPFVSNEYDKLIMKGYKKN